MRNFDRDSALAPDAHGLFDRRDDRLALAPHVCGVETVVALDDPHELDQLLGRGVAARRVDEPRRQAERALGHARGQQALHGRELAGAGRALVEAHHGDPQGAVTHEGGDVDRAAARLDGVEIPAERAPGHGRDLEVALPHRHEVAHAGLVDRRRRHAAVADHVGRDPLMDGRLGAGRAEHGQVGVRMGVDEPRRDVAPAGVDHDRRGTASSRHGPGGRDRRHEVALDEHVGRHPGVAGAVDEAAVREDDAACGPAPGARAPRPRTRAVAAWSPVCHGASRASGFIRERARNLPANRRLSRVLRRLLRAPAGNEARRHTSAGDGRRLTVCGAALLASTTLWV